MAEQLLQQNQEKNCSYQWSPLHNVYKSLLNGEGNKVVTLHFSEAIETDY